jgi:hypothetical protein
MASSDAAEIVLAAAWCSRGILPRTARLIAAQRSGKAGIFVCTDRGRIPRLHHTKDQAEARVTSKGHVVLPCAFYAPSLGRDHA